MSYCCFSLPPESKAEGSAGQSAESEAGQGSDSELDRYVYTVINTHEICKFSDVAR